ncbi:MAG: hypothetical protein H0W68_10270 [Gemmatimonadaceae bacterium]|nr:hypothetical protein [Gemmatimonadaceae bacterium]
MTLLVLSLVACRKAPSREEALAAFRIAEPALDGSPVTERVWQDGPPWFSCAEVIAKLRSATDTGFVRNPLGNWRQLVVADRITLHDTASGPVADPGWCVAHLRAEPKAGPETWRSVLGDLQPPGLARRGWDVPAGVQRAGLAAAPRSLGGDSAVADFVLTVDPNGNGRAIGVQDDTIRVPRLLRRTDGRWTVDARAIPTRASQRSVR